MYDNSNYIRTAQTILFNSLGVFFAFSKSQFLESKQEGIKYTSIGSGMVVPSENVEKLVDELEKIAINGIAKDIKENGMASIMQREFANYECQITCNYDDVKDALKDYGFNEDDFKSQWVIYWDKCVENNLF